MDYIDINDLKRLNKNNINVHFLFCTNKCFCQTTDSELTMGVSAFWRAIERMQYGAGKVLQIV